MDVMLVILSYNFLKSLVVVPSVEDEPGTAVLVGVTSSVLLVEQEEKVKINNTDGMSDFFILINFKCKE